VFLGGKHNVKGNENYMEQSSPSEVNMKVLKCAGEGWRRSAGPIVGEVKKC